LTTLEKVAGLGDKRSWLIVNNQEEAVKRAGRNLTYTKIINLDNLNLVDLLKYKNLLLSADVLELLEKKYV
jgi:ribosomal protein L4